MRLDEAPPGKRQRPSEREMSNCTAKDNARHPSGFTLIELLVVVAIISLLVSILLPSLKRAQDLAKSVVCQSNLKQIGLAMQMYAEDYDGALPPDLYWASFVRYYLAPYEGGDNSIGNVHYCPVYSDFAGYGSSHLGSVYYPKRKIYGDFVIWPKSFESLPGQHDLAGSYATPAGTTLLYECSENCAALPYHHWRHNDQMNVVYLDGHVETTGP